MSSQIARKVVMAFQQHPPYIDAKDKLAYLQNKYVWLYGL